MSNANTSWKNGGVLAENRSGHGSIIWNDRLYVIGGRTGLGTANATGTVKSAPLDNSGGIGAWRAETPLPGNRTDLAVALSPAGTLYVAGGLDETITDKTTVWYASMSGDGRVGPWKTATPLPVALSGHTMAAIGIYLVVVGGTSAAVPVSTAYVARMNSDGTLGPWLTGTALPTALGLHGMAVQDRDIYLLGGGTDSNLALSNPIYKNSLNADGKLGLWQTVGSIASPRVGAAVAVVNGVAYSIGGLLPSGVGNITGTATFTNGSAALVGSGTAFLTDLAVGDYIRPDTTDRWYVVAAIADDTHVTLTEPFLGTTAAGATINEQRPISRSTVEVTFLLSGVVGAPVIGTALPVAQREMSVVVDDDNSTIYVTGGDTGTAQTNAIQVGLAREGTGRIG